MRLVEHADATRAINAITSAFLNGFQFIFQLLHFVGEFVDAAFEGDDDVFGVFVDVHPGQVHILLFVFGLEACDDLAVLLAVDRPPTSAQECQDS